MNGTSYVIIRFLAEENINIGFLFEAMPRSILKGIPIQEKRGQILTPSDCKAIAQPHSILLRISFLGKCDDLLRILII